MSQDTDRDIVATPWRRRFRLWRERRLPLVAWIAAVVLAIVVIQRQSFRIDAVGIVEVNESIVAPLDVGMIGHLYVDLFTTVEAGQVVAVMADDLVSAELNVAEAELAQLRATLEAERHRAELDISNRAIDDPNDLRRFIMNQEEARLDYLDRLAQQETDKVTLQQLAVQLEIHQRGLSDGIVERATYDELRLQHDALETQIEQTSAAIELAKHRVTEAEARRIEREQQVLTGMDVAEFLAPFKEEVAAQGARIQEVMVRRATLALKAPLSGRVSAIFYHAGETVPAGEPILAITEPMSQRVVAYVEEIAGLRLKTGLPVQIRSRGRPPKVIEAEIIKIGSRIERLPMRLWRNPVAPQRGLAILVGDVPEDAFLPGETVDLTFLLRRDGP